MYGPLAPFPTLCILPIARFPTSLWIPRGSISCVPDRSRAVGGRVLKERYLRFPRSCRDAIRFAQAPRGSVDVPPHGGNPEQRKRQRLQRRHSAKPQLFLGLQLPV